MANDTKRALRVNWIIWLIWLIWLIWDLPPTLQDMADNPDNLGCTDCMEVVPPILTDIPASAVASYSYPCPKGPEQSAHNSQEPPAVPDNPPL